jgi:hypothetical protein
MSLLRGQSSKSFCLLDEDSRAWLSSSHAVVRGAMEVICDILRESLVAAPGHYTDEWSFFKIFRTMALQLREQHITLGLCLSEVTRSKRNADSTLRF